VREIGEELDLHSAFEIDTQTNRPFETTVAASTAGSDQ
jgi:hypothetical protein